MNCQQTHKMVFLGPPGVGKGTQAKKVAKILRIPQVSTGDILRTEIKNETDIGRSATEYIVKGQLVPDDVVMALVKIRLLQPDCTSGYILDGFPRNLKQAQAIDKENIELHKVVVFDADDTILIQRLSGRRVCPNCNAMFHTVYHPPITPGICDICKSELIIRKDDDYDTVQHRINVYRDETAPLIDYYQLHPIVDCVTIDAGKTIYDTPDVVLERVLEVLCKKECAG